MGDQMKADFRSKEMDHLRNQFEFHIISEFIETIEVGFKTHSVIIKLNGKYGLLRAYHAI